MPSNPLLSPSLAMPPPTSSTLTTSSSLANMQDRPFNIALIGAGGVGTIAALVLEKSGRARVTAVLRSNYEVVSQKGWEIESVDHPEVKTWKCWRVVPSISAAVFAPPVPTPPIPTGAPTPLEPAREIYDYIVLTTKQLPSTHNLAEMISPLVTPGHTSIVLIQNGLNIQLPFVSKFPRNVVMSAVTMIGSFTEGENKVRQLGHDILEIGPHFHPGVSDPASLEKTRGFVDMYREGGAKSVTLITEDMQKARWTKLLWNGTYNPICAILRIHVGHVQSCESAREGLVLPIMREIQAVARRDGVLIEDEVVLFMASRSPKTSTWRPSMLLDREQGREMEFEVILGNPIRRAKELGVETPVMCTVYELARLVGWSLAHPGDGEVRVG